MSNNILFHGATTIVSEPLTHVGRQELDFGPGFYLTNDREQAEKWARIKSERKKHATAILNIYKFDYDLFNNEADYHNLLFTEYNIEWLDFIAANRKGKSLWKEYDCIEGGIANDSVISTVDAYVDGFITAEQALDNLVNQELRHQICISNQSIIDKYLRFLESITI